MLLYLIRHAEAEDLGTGGVSRDFDRPLTAHGRLQAQALAKVFVRLNLPVDTVVASPLVRAYQTAKELLAVWHPEDRPVTCDELAIDKFKPAKLSSFLADLPARGQRSPSRGEKAIAAVGHMPDIAAYLAWLIGANPGTIHMAKAAAACIKFKTTPARAEGELRWLVTPDWFLDISTES
jgi:phosphohistidine phosphatase